MLMVKFVVYATFSKIPVNELVIAYTFEDASVFLKTRTSGADELKYTQLGTSSLSLCLKLRLFEKLAFVALTFTL